MTNQKNGQHYQKNNQEVLHKFISIFKDPTSLPPSRPIDHKIELIPEAKPIHIK